VTHVLALAGGVGGAKLVLGLSSLLSQERLTVVVNTGDDEEFFGLHVSPDIDTVSYNLAGISNIESGWGIEGESFRMLQRLESLGVDTWFKLGDLDLATHVRRTQLLRSGHTLSDTTGIICRSMGINQEIIPMTDGQVRTVLQTTEGSLKFQEYFVQRKCEPIVTDITYTGSELYEASSGFIRAIDVSDALVFCPSNPFLSIAPMLALKDIRKKIAAFTGPRVVVSPVIGGRALKGPTSKILEELDYEVSSLGIARMYRGICDTFVLDNTDIGFEADIRKLGMDVCVTDTIMESLEDKIGLARVILEICN
tara:strand:- start:896 stop:1825 length:930 start_codon:yes stop_codon:yes gene_type:complete